MIMFRMNNLISELDINKKIDRYIPGKNKTVFKILPPQIYNYNCLYFKNP